LTPLVDWFLEKSSIMQIKDMHFSNMINKVENTNIWLKFQSGHTISIAASIRDIFANSGNRPIENSNLFVNDKINSDSIGQHIVSYAKADSASLSKLKPLKSSYKGVAEWIDVKSDPFVCLPIKPTPQKNQLRKSKYTFDFTFYDHVFDILPENNFNRIIDHNVLSSIQNLEELTYCKWYNSFDHNTCDCNMFRRVIQSAIDKGRLKFSKAQQMGQLDSIGLDGKQVSNWLALLADSSKALMMAENQVMETTDHESHLGEPIAIAAAESAQPPLGMAKPTPAVSKTAKPTQWSAKPSGEAVVALPEVESARRPGGG
jgi:hypothetical protein